MAGDAVTAEISTSAGDQLTAPTPPTVGVTGKLIPGTTEADRRRKSDLRWLKKAEHWGEWIRYSDTEPAPPERVWMMRGPSGKVRFYAEGKGQVGAEHASVVAACYWAWANRWLGLDPFGDLDILAELECRQWCLNGGDDAQFVNVADHVDSRKAIAR